MVCREHVASFAIHLGENSHTLTHAQTQRLGLAAQTLLS